MEEVVSHFLSDAPRTWKKPNPITGNPEYINPIRGGKSFKELTPSERVSYRICYTAQLTQAFQLDLMEALMYWAMYHNKRVKHVINESYKYARGTDDKNVGVAVVPWGRDGEDARYYCIEGNGTRDNESLIVLSLMLTPR